MPSPQGFFFAIAESFRASLAALPFRLPDLQECHAAFDVEQGMPPAGQTWPTMTATCLLLCGYVPFFGFL